MTLDYAGTDDFISVADYNGIDVTTALTVQCYMNPDAVTAATFYSVMAKGKDATATYQYNLLHVAAVPRFSMYDGTNNPEAIGTSTSVVGTWYSLAGVFDNTNLMIYKNGTLETTQSKGSLTTAAQTSNFSNGRNANGVTMDFDGKASHLCIWRSVIPTAQLAAIARGANPFVFDNDNLGMYMQLDTTGTQPNWGTDVTKTGTVNGDGISKHNGGYPVEFLSNYISGYC